MIMKFIKKWIGRYNRQPLSEINQKNDAKCQKEFEERFTKPIDRDTIIIHPAISFSIETIKSCNNVGEPYSLNGEILNKIRVNGKIYQWNATRKQYIQRGQE